MYGKAMVWGKGHVDKYIFRDGEWVNVACSLSEPGMHCTAPRRLARGTKFDYNCHLTEAEEQRTE